MAEIDEVIAGFCHVGPSPDDDAGEGTGHFYAIYVVPRFARPGIGRQVLRAGIASLAEFGFSEAALWILVSNDRSCRGAGAAGRQRGPD